MKVREAMTRNPVCCTPTETADKVARMMCEHDVGSIPVVTDGQSRKLAGIITDRDLCCSVVTQGLDPKRTSIEPYMRRNPVTCRDDDGLEGCEQAMQKHQVRRMPVIDEQGRCIGIVAQADLALKDRSDNVSQTVAAISQSRAAAA